jgi:two-component system, cell cycle sensor histidine kinase and response regulator CckA
MLRHLGYQATACDNGADAVELFTRARESGTPYKAIVMDLTIPGGMGGKDAAEQMLRIDPGACLIVSSGYSEDPVMSDYSRYGFSGAVAKPYKMRALGQLLSDVFQKRA